MSSQNPSPEARFAHELREALGAMQMALEVLRRPSDDSTRSRMLELLDRQLGTLGQLADRAASGGTAPSGEAGTCRILVVDDNIDSAEVLGALLEHMGHEVFVAYTGARALEVAHERRPDVVLLDLALPDMSGFDVARAMRKDAALSGARLVGLTGFDSEEHKQRAREAGLDAYLVKPVDAERLGALLGGPRKA